MELINYLSRYFLTAEQLIERSKITTSQLAEYQQLGVMPEPSYSLKLGIESKSFFGEHKQNYTVDYYAKGYPSWLGIIQNESNTNRIYQIFSSRYKQTIKQLKLQGHCVDNEKLLSGLDKHIAEEWMYFLDGTYGLCTVSGLPEDIAAKEFAICEINELTSKQNLDPQEVQQLTLAVNLLDSASALFAPHEREKSSRQRLVNDVRCDYCL